MTANLTRNVILELLSHLDYVLSSGGWLVLSGILKEQVGDIQEALAGFHFHKEQVLFHEEWASLMTKKVGED